MSDTKVTIYTLYSVYDSTSVSLCSFMNSCNRPFDQYRHRVGANMELCFNTLIGSLSSQTYGWDIIWPGQAGIACAGSFRSMQQAANVVRISLPSPPVGARPVACCCVPGLEAGLQLLAEPFHHRVQVTSPWPLACCCCHRLSYTVTAVLNCIVHIACAATSFIAMMYRNLPLTSLLTVQVTRSTALPLETQQ